MHDDTRALPVGAPTERGAVPLHQPVTLADLHAVCLDILAAARTVQAQLAAVLGSDDAVDVAALRGGDAAALRGAVESLDGYRDGRRAAAGLPPLHAAPGPSTPAPGGDAGA